MVTQDFGARADAVPQLLGVVFDDADGDSVYDAGEGMGGVTVTITGNGHTMTTTTWDAGGYQLGLDPGSYSVVFSGGGLDGVVRGTVTPGGENAALDARAADAVPAITTISGDTAANRLAGTVWEDQIFGGADAFVFDRLPGAGNVDHILDFNRNAAAEGDTLRMAHWAFAGVARGALSETAFHTGATAQDAADRFLYDAAAGQLWFDADGTGAADRVLVATFSAGTALSAADIFVF